MYRVKHSSGLYMLLFILHMETNNYSYMATTFLAISVPLIIGHVKFM